MRRVAVVGSGGAGKSTLARALGGRLDLPVIHLDEHYWKPGWQPCEARAWRDLQEQLVGEHEWIIDGNYVSTLDLRVRAADTVVFLDLPAWRCVSRATRRVMKGRGRANTAPGCPERLDRRHLEFLRYVWRFPRVTRPVVLDALDRHRVTTTVIRLTSPREVRLFLSGGDAPPPARHPPRPS